MADATITIDANTTQLVAKAKQAETVFRKVGDGISHAGKNIEYAGKKAEESFGRAALNMGRAVVAARMAITAIKSVTDSISQSLETQANRSTSKGGAALRASQAAAAGGLDQRIVSAFLAKADAMTIDEKASLIESISKEGGNIDNKRLNEITSAASSGVFSSSQLQDAITNGGALDIGAQSAQLSPAAQRELETRIKVNALNAQQGGISGDIARVAAAERASKDRASPGLAGLRNSIGFIGEPITNFLDLQNADKSIKDDAQERTAAATEKIAAEVKKLNTSGITDHQ